MLKDKVKVKGRLEFYEIIKDETGKVIEEKLLGIWNNLLPETGRELLADVMVNDISLYTNGIYPQYLAVGTDNTAATVDDWKLGSEQQRANITAPNMERISGTSIAQFTATIPSGGGTYTIYEAGLFLSATEPTSDPQDTPAQRANAMVTRSVESDGIPKNNATDLKIVYQIQF